MDGTSDIINIVNVEVEGMKIALQVSGKLAMLVAQSTVKLLKALIKVGTEHRDKKLAKLSGCVSIDKLKLREGENLCPFYVSDKDDILLEFDRRMKQMGIPYATLPDFNKEDGKVYIVVGSQQVGNVNFIIEAFQKECLDKGLIEEGEKVAKEQTIEDYIKSNGGLTTEETIELFEKNIQSYCKENNVSVEAAKAVSNNPKQQELWNKVLNDEIVLKGKELNDDNSISIMASLVIDEEEKFVCVAIDKNENIKIDKADLAYDKEKNLLRIKTDAQVVASNGQEFNIKDIEGKINWYKEKYMKQLAKAYRKETRREAQINKNNMKTIANIRKTKTREFPVTRR